MGRTNHGPDAPWRSAKAYHSLYAVYRSRVFWAFDRALRLEGILVSEFERSQAVLPERYSLLREIDLGGMFRVYLTREQLPDRDVAIKVFDEKFSAQLQRSGSC